MNSDSKQLLKAALILATCVGAVLGALRGCNVCLNTSEKKTPTSHTISRPIGLFGRVEYTRFNDKSVEVKVYNGIATSAHRYDLLQDRNGDGLVDKLKKYCVIWNRENRNLEKEGFNDVLVREKDYATHKDEFDRADEQLLEYKVLADGK